MKNLRKKFELFCFRNRDKGIPNLMLYIVIGTAVVYLFSQMSGNALLYSALRFDRTSILQGQVWRLITYPLTYSAGNILLTAITLLCYYSLGRAMENVWGTLRFNLFYLTGVVMMDVYCLIFGGQASVTYLNLSLFLSYATLYPDANFLLFFIIPVKAWIFALIDLAMVLLSLFTDPFPYNLFSVISLANYFLFFGSDIKNILPDALRYRQRKNYRTTASNARPNPNWAGSYRSKSGEKPYRHKCTVCGRTDTDYPNLEFRYCSKCNGYYCYCIDHINNHVHITTPPEGAGKEK